MTETISLRILKAVFLLPNLPMFAVISVYIYSQILKESGIVEMEIMQEKEGTIMTEEIKEWVDQIYPKILRYIVSIFGWYTLFILLY